MKLSIDNHWNLLEPWHEHSAVYRQHCRAASGLIRGHINSTVIGFVQITPESLSVEVYKWYSNESTWWLMKPVKVYSQGRHLSLLVNFTSDNLYSSWHWVRLASFSLLISPPGPAVGPAPGVCSVWSDSSCVLRFCPGTNSLTLTVRQAPGGRPQDGIVFLRDRLADHGILRLVRSDQWEHLFISNLAPCQI